MEEKIKKESKFVDNVAYKNKFQFLIWANGNVICQRYFKINGFNEDAVYSEAFNDCMNGIVKSIQDDLVSKSRVFMWYTDTTEPLKMKGFMTDEEIEKYGSEFLGLITDKNIVGTVEAPDGKLFQKEYVKYHQNNDDENFEYDRPCDGECIFKFSFLIDDKIVFEKMWDGNVYPKFVRNGVDLTNYHGLNDNTDISSLNFGTALIRHMQIGKINLISDFIRRICETLSNNYVDKSAYARDVMIYDNNNVIDREKYDNAVKYYGVIKPIVTGHTDIEQVDKKYNYLSNFESYKHSWKKSVRKKTQEYFDTMYPSPRQIEYIDKHY